jgi:hypothetical protein
MVITSWKYDFRGPLSAICLHKAVTLFDPISAVSFLWACITSLEKRMKRYSQPQFLWTGLILAVYHFVEAGQGAMATLLISFTPHRPMYSDGPRSSTGVLKWSKTSFISSRV